MLVSLNWLEDYIDLSDIDGIQLAERITRTGIEIESIKNFADHLSNLVTGEIRELYPHHDADQLNVTLVDVGGTELEQIVCGAPNVYEGAKVIVALPGAMLPELTITQSEIRGIESNGMICSLQELGFDENVIPKKYNDGVLILPEDTPVGEDVIEYLNLDDTILELDITPNRADALSILGNVYEVAAILDQTPAISFETDSTNETEHLLNVELGEINPNISENYQLRLIRDVSVEESPLWLQIRLMKSGIRPINNIVDITNYMLLLFGQPMHAFDYDKLTEDSIKVDYGRGDQVLTTLDGIERQLSEQDGVIYNGDIPIALAGVMGGLETEVTDETHNVLLETALFDSTTIQKSSKKYNLRSESSQRFEKGINKATVNLAGDVAAKLIAELSGGHVEGGYLVQKTSYELDKTIRVERDAIKNQIGIELSDEELIHIMNRLQFPITMSDEYFEVTAPARRWDLAIEADILEEVARIYGYDNIPITLPQIQSNLSGLSTNQQLLRKTRRLMESYGLNQVISYSLQSDRNAQLLATNPERMIRLQWPMSEERTILRQSLLPALLETAQYNQARQNNNLALYEIGRVFEDNPEEALPLEQERLAILLSGQAQLNRWYQSARDYDFFDLKGIIESYIGAINFVEPLKFVKDFSYSELHPGRTALIYIGDQQVGVIGQIHPTICKQFDLHSSTYFSELDLELLFALERRELSQQPIPKYPSTARDIAILVPNTQNHQQLVTIMNEAGGSNLVSIHLFDYYEGDKIDDGYLSLAYRLTFQNPSYTLSDEQVEEAMERIVSALSEVNQLRIR